ncbi:MULTISPECIES: hypothetical protein [unclassified Streptomyces]|uniref:hypothetical protein n=1 Tax=unclassified Streptomyces TaxID=2593676 RepID=UPI002E81057D|nr:hypothetical protein [Streptomyces sp. NBC_00569]WUB92527.1 hypothetical protein OHO83_09505 [Streptomyces sp. NBC_00569]
MTGPARWCQAQGRIAMPLVAPSPSARLSASRPAATSARHDKLAVRYEATVLVAAINEWL